MNEFTLQTACLSIEDLERFYQSADASEQLEIMQALPAAVRVALVDNNYAMIETILLFCFGVRQKIDYHFGSLFHRFGYNHDNLKELLIFLLGYQSQLPVLDKPTLTQTMLAILATLLDDITSAHRFDLNAVRDACGQGLLIKAIANFPEAVNVLLEYGMNANGKKEPCPGDELLPPPLFRIEANRPIYPNKRDYCAILGLRRSVAHPLFLNLDWEHPLFTAIAQCSLQAGSDVHQTVLKQLLQHPSLRIKHQCALTPLMFAAYLGDVSLLKLLLQKGFDINQTDSMGHHALVYAMRSQQKEAIVFLVTEGALLSLEVPSTNSTTSNQKTVVHVTDIELYCTPEIKNFITQFEQAYFNCAWLAVRRSVERYSSNDPLLTLMRPKGYHLALHSVPADGDCLYHAAVLYETNKTAATLRSEVADLIETGCFNEFLTGSSEQYAQNVRDGLWGGEIELNAIAICLNRPVVVLNESGAEPKTYQSSLPQLPIFIAYNGINHYSGLLPEKGYHLKEVYDLFQTINALKTLPADLIRLVLSYLPMSSLIPSLYICDEDKQEITTLIAQFLVGSQCTVNASLTINSNLDPFYTTSFPTVEDDDPLDPLSLPEELEHLFSGDDEEYETEIELDSPTSLTRKRALSPNFFSWDKDAEDINLQETNLEATDQDRNRFKKLRN